MKNPYKLCPNCKPCCDIVAAWQEGFRAGLEENAMQYHIESDRISADLSLSIAKRLVDETTKWLEEMTNDQSSA